MNVERTKHGRSRRSWEVTVASGVVWLQLVSTLESNRLQVDRDYFATESSCCTYSEWCS